MNSSVKIPSSILRKSYVLFPLIRSGWAWALAAFLANLAAALSEGATVGFLLLALKALVGGSPHEGIPGWAARWVGEEHLFLALVLCAVGAQLFRSLLQFAGCWATAHLQARVHREGFQRIFQKILLMPFPKVTAHRLGDLTHLLEESRYLHELLAQVNLLVRSILLAAAYAVVLLCLSWRLSLLALALYGLISQMLRWVIRKVQRHSASLTEATQRLHRRTTEFVQGIRVIHTFARQEEAAEQVGKISDQGMKASRATTIWGSVMEPVIDSLMILGAAFFLLAGTLWLGPQAKAALPALLAFLLALHRMTPRLGAVTTSLAAIAAIRPHLARILDFLQEEEVSPVSSSSRAGRPFERLRDQVEFRGVSLRYRSDEPPALEGFSGAMPRGGFTALVGASGAGKSSVVDLLIRLYEPTSGEIVVDGIPIQDYSLRSWRDRLGVVAQDPFLFHASIWENIAYGRPGASREEVLAAARAAHVEEFVGRLAQGYDTLIGDRGCRLSGGQRQRIALARALVRQPQILILDEAMSALDSESERLIQEALEEQRGRCTLLVVAHRLSTVRSADQIWVLASGRPVEQGTHGDLLARQGIYTRLWRIQSPAPPEAVPA